MPPFPRHVLLAISELSGNTYMDVDGQDLFADLRKREQDYTMPQLIRVMRQLQDAGYVSCHFLGGLSGIELIQLQHRGRQEVEGWPVVPGQLSANDVDALLQTLAARATDPDVAEPEQGKARAAATAIKDLGLNVSAQVLGAWLRHVTGVG